MQSGGLMTADAFVARYDRLAARAIAPSFGARLLARIRAHSLDRALIAGEDPASCPRLAARASNLTSRRSRTMIAALIDNLLPSAAQPSVRSRRVRPRREAIVAHADQLSALAELLRERSPVYARGVAMLFELLSDGTGPLYHGMPELLGERLEQARSALVG